LSFELFDLSTMTVLFTSPSGKTGQGRISTSPSAIRQAVASAFLSAEALLATNDLETFRDELANLKKQVANEAVAAATASYSHKDPMKRSDIIAMKKDDCKPLATKIDQSISGETLIAASLELTSRRNYNPCWSGATILTKTTTSDDNEDAIPVEEDIDLLRDTHSITREEMKAMVTARWSDPQAVMRANDGHSLEFTVNCLGTLLYASLEPEFLSTIETACSDYPTDGQYLWHSMFHIVFPNIGSLKTILKSSLRLTAMNGNDWSANPDGLTYVTRLREHLRFDSSMKDDDESKQNFYDVMKNHPDAHIKTVINDLSLKQFKDSSTAEDFATVLSKLDLEIRTVLGRNRLVSASSMCPRLPSPAKTQPPRPTGSLNRADDTTNISAMYAEVNTRFGSLGKAMNMILKDYEKLDRELRDHRAKCDRRFNTNRRFQSNHDDRDCRGDRDRHDNREQSDRGSEFSWDQYGKKRPTTRPPFFEEAPPSDYDGKGITWNDKLYHFKPEARGNRGGWYYDSPPSDDTKKRSVGFTTKDDGNMSDSSYNQSKRTKWDNNKKPPARTTIPVSVTNRNSKISAFIAHSTTSRHAANNSKAEK
jgi:hypothetical protein